MSAPIILIPCKRLAEGKSRLAAVLDAAERTALCTAFLRRTLALAAEVTPAARIAVVSADPLALALAREIGGRGLAEQAAGLNPALEAARAALEPGGGRLVILPIDLPLATAGAVADALRGPEDVVLAPDRTREGTNLLALGPRALRPFRFAYGPGSFAVHAAAARAQALSLRVVDDARLACDIDDEAAYRAWRAAFPAP